MILDFNIARLLKNAAIEYFHTFVENAAECETITSAELLHRVWVALQASVDEVERVSKVSLKSDYTAPILSLDEQRDNVWTGLYHIVNGYRKSLNQETANTATSVWNSLNSFRIRTNDQYIRETGMFDRLLGVLLGEQLENVTALNLLPQVQELNRLNEELHRLVNERDIENKNKPEKAFENARRAAEASYRDFVWVVNAYYQIMVIEAKQPNPALDSFFLKSNTVIRRYNQQQFHRGTSEEIGGVEESVPDATPPETDPTNPPSTEQPPTTEPPSTEQPPTTEPPTTEQPTMYTVTWKDKAGETVKTMQVEAGTKLTSSDFPKASSGYEWQPNWLGGGLTVNSDLTINEVIPEDMGV